MTKKFYALCVVLAWTVSLTAQQISVVSNGSTSIHSTLQAAIEAAASGSVIYLPGGGFPIDDSVKVTKPITIIGIGHKVKGENADGYTTIQGNIFFNEGSSGSAIMGVYMTGNVKIGSDGKEVDNVLVRFCNLNSVEVNNNKCLGTVVNQNYIRSESKFSSASAEFTNNICHSVTDLDNGVIANNIFVHTTYYYSNGGSRAIHYTDNTSINDNVFLDWGDGPHIGNNCLASGNMAMANWGDDSINVSGVAWTDIFENPVGVTPQSKYRFKGDYQKYNSKCGIYAGTGFSDTALPPVPYIVAKQIPDQTDANGKLNIKIRVRAGE